jgi:hypothetical protein
MALVLNDRVKETTTTTGTGTLTLAGAATGFETFSSGIGNGNTTYYAIASDTGSQFEVGIGTVNAGVLQRDVSVISSSNSDALENFAAGTKNVFCTFPASKTMEMVLTTQGDVPYASAANTPARLALGSAGQILQVNSGGTAPEWATSSSVSAGFAVAMAIAL